MLDFLKLNGKDWVVSQREKYRAKAKDLRHEDKVVLENHFHARTLGNIRICHVDQINNPHFYASFEKTGQPIPLDFRQMRGITFIDTIVIAGSKVTPGEWRPLLFHECVHVCQFTILGVDEFINRYIDGWAGSGYDYASIPLEVDAYELQREYESSTLSPLSVEFEIKRRIGVT